MSGTKPVCVNLPPDLEAAVRERANTEGLTLSEFLRAIISQWIYGQAPSTDDGYAAGRRLAIHLANAAMPSIIPETYEEAIERMKALQAARGWNNRG